MELIRDVLLSSAEDALYRSRNDLPYELCIDYQERLEQIRRLYKAYLPNIKEKYPVLDARFAHWSPILSPAEVEVWELIKRRRLPFYPQFPVENYFIDFADPIKKVAIEVDGKAYHKDTVKDMQRQREIEGMGWQFIRVPGSIALRALDEEEDDYMSGFIKDGEGLYRVSLEEYLNEMMSDERY